MNLIELYKQIYNENKSNNKYIYLDGSQFSIVVTDELQQVLGDKKYLYKHIKHDSHTLAYILPKFLSIV